MSVEHFLVPYDLLGASFRVANDVDAGGECRESSPDRALSVEHLNAVSSVQLKGAGTLVNCDIFGAGVPEVGIFGEIIAKVRGLVVCHVLPADRHAVGAVFHQAGYTMLRCDSSAMDIDYRGVSVVPQYDLFTPITEDVRRQARSLF